MLMLLLSACVCERDERNAITMTADSRYSWGDRSRECMKNKTFKFNPVLVTIQKVCVKVTDLCMKIAQGLFSKKKKIILKAKKNTRSLLAMFFLQRFFNSSRWTSQ